MSQRNDSGKYGEERAVLYLIHRGYTILERNWRIGHKEVDIICTDGKMIIVVEVKTREAGCELPGELIDFRKKRNLLRAGEAYIRAKGLERELRFDLILVSGVGMDVLHIREAIQVFD